jgi:hypothetical protein
MDYQKIIADTLQEAIKSSLSVPRTHRAYNGTQKSTSGKFGPFVSAPLSSGRLQNSVSVFWETPLNSTTPRIVVEFVNAPYWYYIQNGREPGVAVERTRTGKGGNLISYQSFTKFPNLDGIKDWIDQKPILGYTDNLGKLISKDSMAFMIGRGIARDGWQGYDFIGEAWNMSRDVLLPLFGDAIGQYFTDELKKNILIIPEQTR